MVLSDFILEDSATYLDALRAIDFNTRGFVIVVNEDQRVLGTLSDGDIRRKLLAGATIDERLSETKGYNTDYTAASKESTVDDYIDIFKNPKINFLPILDEKSKLVSVITRRQLYGLLLQCKELPPYDDVVNLEENLLDFEIYRRPWGVYKTTVLQEKYQSKIMQINPGGTLSLQYHNRREEYWVVASGEGEVQLGKSTISAHAGSMFFVPRGCVHRIRNTSDKNLLLVIEVQIGDYFGEDDIVRLEDVYGRARR